MVILSDNICRLIDKLLRHSDQLEGLHCRSFGYRERMATERILFLLMRNICLTTMGYRLQGLTEAHRISLLELVEKKKVGAKLKRFITQAFELQAFLCSLSSANPYVQEDALSRVEQTKQNAVKFTARQVRKIALLAMDLQNKDA